MSGIVYIISAPSGSGKTTLTNRLLSLVPGLEFSISYTTRKPRGSEQNGREYFFVTREEFEHMIAQGEFLEHANVFGDYYGTARRFLEQAWAKGKDLVLDIDVQGAGQVKQNMPEAVSIFILPPSREVLEKRLTSRSQAEHVTSTEIARRLAEAAREIEKYPKYDYILINDQLEESIDQLRAIVLAERFKRSSNVSPDREILAKANNSLLPNARQRAQQIFESFGLPPLANHSAR
jgi:guanylate kinase